MIRPSYDEIEKIAAEEKYTILPLSMKVFSDVHTPIGVLQILKGLSNHCFLLESVDNRENWGRYSFLGFKPKLEMTCTDGTMTLDALSFPTDDPNTQLRQILNAYKSPRFDYLPPFTGGFVGYFSYDYLKYAEPSLHLSKTGTADFKDLDLMLFDQVIAFDHLRQKIILIVNMNLSDPETNYPQAVHKLEHLADLIKNSKQQTQHNGQCQSEFQPLFSNEEFYDMVETAKHHIREGDIFQVVLSNRLEAKFSGSLLNTYRVLRTMNPSPFMFYLSGDDIEIAGASPETLVKLNDQTLYTFPLAGTKPRGQTEAKDQALAEALLHDEKECAEHNMLVDLGRNDLGKISQLGSVKVCQYMGIERFSHVMHLGSTVQGNLRAENDALDALQAVLPAGTLSGAPKIRACQLINDLEKDKRGIYGGAIGYIDFTGNMDTCIAIRMAYKKNHTVTIRSGADIVIDSDSQKEHQECLNKARAVVEAIKIAEEMNL